MRLYGCLLLAGLLYLNSFVCAHGEQVKNYVQEVTFAIQKKTGRNPQVHEIVYSLLKLSDKYYHEGNYAAAVAAAEQTNNFAEQALGPEHPYTLTCINDLANFYQSQGKYDKAEPLYLRALKSTEKVFGSKHLRTIVGINNLAVTYRFQGRYSEAESLFLRVVKANEKTLGPEHSFTLTSINNLAELYQSQGRYSEAEPLFLRALTLRKKVLGEEHRDTLTSMHNLAEIYRVQGRFKEAESLLQKVIDARENVLGQDHPDTLISINSFALLYESQGRLVEAEHLYQRVVEANKRVLGEEHPDTLSSMNNLALLYKSQGRFSKSEPLLLRVLAIKKKIFGLKHPATLISINNLATLYESQGRFAAARPLYQQVVEMNEKLHGAQHPNTLTSVSNLALLYKSCGLYAEAESLYLRVLAGRKKNLGLEHPDTLASVNNLAALYESQGRFGEAESLYLRAVASWEKKFGPEYPGTLVNVNNLAVLYESQGRFGEAESLFLRVLAAKEKVLGLEHPDTFASVNNLASLYESQGRFGEAESLYLRAVTGWEKAFGPEHPSTLTGFNNLAAFYEHQNRFVESERLCLKALIGREKVLGPEHPDTLDSVNNLSTLYGAQGRFREATSLCLRALEGQGKVLGSEHLATLTSIGNLAELYRVQGRFVEADPLYLRTIKGREKVLGPEHPKTLFVQLNYVINLISSKRFQRAFEELKIMEPRMLEFASLQLRHTRQENVRRLFLKNQSSFIDIVLNLALDHPKPEYQAFAAKVMFRWKQIMGEEEAFLGHLVHTRGGLNPEIAELSSQIAFSRRDLSHLINASSSNRELLQRKLKKLEDEEIQLVHISAEFSRHLQVRNVNVEDVREHIPRGSGALLELRVYHPFDFMKGSYGEPHWVALLLPARGSMSLHDLGAVEETREMVQKLRAKHSQDVAATLYKKLFGLLDDKIKGYAPLYIAPDGVLNLLAFAELVMPDGRYWFERQELHQIATGRHLICRDDRGLNKSQGILTLGGIDYDKFDAGEKKKSKRQTQFDQYQANDFPLLSDEIEFFETLGETENEAKEVANLYWDNGNVSPQVWLKEDASEYRLKKLNTSPRVLHLATHGFYFGQINKIVDRPMGLSGLALAGANQGLKGKTGPNGEDGILYAMEVQSLNLEDTELVTLSACDTGKGKLDYSEGVYGLVRAFQIAGAHNVLMALWPVSDVTTRDFMRQFYLNWLTGPKPKELATALRETRLTFIQSNDESLSDPQAWAPFVLVEGR